MKSTTLIHEISAEFGEDRTQELNRELKKLRTQIKAEVFRKVNLAINTTKLIYINNGDQ